VAVNQPCAPPLRVAVLFSASYAQLAPCLPLLLLGLAFALARIALRHHGHAAFPLTLLRCLHDFAHLAAPCTLGTNASGLATMAFSALPAGSTPAVLSAIAGAAPTTTGNVPPHVCDALTPEDPTSSMSAFSTTPGSPKGSTSSGNAGDSELPTQYRRIWPSLDGLMGR